MYWLLGEEQDKGKKRGTTVYIPLTLDLPPSTRPLQSCSTRRAALTLTLRQPDRRSRAGVYSAAAACVTVRDGDNDAHDAAFRIHIHLASQTNPYDQRAPRQHRLHAEACTHMGEGSARCMPHSAEAAATAKAGGRVRSVRKGGKADGVQGRESKTGADVGALRQRAPWLG